MKKTNIKKHGLDVNLQLSIYYLLSSYPYSMGDYAVH
jgi:hypothetical protein